MARRRRQQHRNSSNALLRDSAIRRDQRRGGVVNVRKIVLAGLAAIGLLSSGASFARVPAPVPALPDADRPTAYSITASQCNCSVNFAILDDSGDYRNWVEVWLNGVRVNYNDSTFGWTVTSPTGALASIPRPVRYGVLTFTNVQTGMVQIVGARRPRRVSQFNENPGVLARNNQVTDITATPRELWHKTNEVTGRTVLAPPGETLKIVP